MTAHISQLFIYPVKSLQGIPTNTATLHKTGLEYDRFWMLINTSQQFITQRQYPQLASISVALDETTLRFMHSTHGEISLPLAHKEQQQTLATVWQDACYVSQEADGVNQYFSEFLQQSVQLVRMAKHQQRPQSKPTVYGEHTHTYFADAAPYLICNSASLDRLNQALAREQANPVEIINFRPNIVISGLDAFAEHSITSLFSDDYRFNICYPCQRCVIPTIDLHRYQRRADKQPYKMLSEMNPMPDNPKAPAFGENAILLDGEQSLITVGDQIDFDDLNA